VLATPLGPAGRIRVGVIESCDALVLGSSAGLRRRVLVHGQRASLAHRLLRERHEASGRSAFFEDDTTRPAGPRGGHRDVWIWFAPRGCRGPWRTSRLASTRRGTCLAPLRCDGRVCSGGRWRMSRLASSRGSCAGHSPRACRAHSRRRDRELRGARARQRCWPASPRPRAWPTSAADSQASSRTTRSVRQVRLLRGRHDASGRSAGRASRRMDLVRAATLQRAVAHVASRIDAARNVSRSAALRRTCLQRSAVAHVASRIIARFVCWPRPSGLPGAFASA
jgi:hypothetical protein